jgi:hypothetical protein
VLHVKRFGQIDLRPAAAKDGAGIRGQRIIAIVYKLWPTNFLIFLPAKA